MGLLSFFKGNKSKTMLEEARGVAAPVIINGYRKIAKSGNLAPTLKTSDNDIIRIYQQVGSAFQEASKQRNEFIPAGNMNAIVLKFFQVYEKFGEEFYYEHLKYEIDKYLNEGLRDDYKRDLKLF